MGKAKDISELAASLWDTVLDLCFSGIAFESATEYSARVLEMISSAILWFEKCEFQGSYFVS